MLLYKVFCVTWLISTAGADPRFIRWPNNKNPIYKKVAETAVFQWEFFRDGASFSFGTLKKVDTAITIATLRTTGAGSVVGAGYTSRASLTATDRSNNYFIITFELRQLIRTDDGAYEFEVHTSKSVKGMAELVVVVPPTITYRNPSGSQITITEGQEQTLECAADGNPKPAVEWLRDNILVERNKSVTLNPITREHGGNYRCKATVVADTTYVASFVIEVKVQYKPYITSGLNNRTVSEGNSVLFNCEAKGYPVSITYTWYKSDLKLLSSGNYEITDGGKRLTIRSAGKGDIGQYKCTGKNSIGEGKGSLGYLSVKYKPTLVAVAPYPDVTKEELDSVTLTCQADGEPPPSFKWEFNNHLITGETGKSLLLNNLRKGNIGNYSCVATNEIGATKNYTMVFVRYKPTTVNLTTGTADNAVVQGTTASLVCISDGYPEPSYTFKKGSTLLVADSVSRTYTIPGSIALSHEGEYSCTPKNLKGDGPTATMKLNVLVKPALTNNIQPTTKTENQNFTYTCTATGKPAPLIRWYKDGKEISKSSIYDIVETVGSSTTPRVLKTQVDLIMTGLTWRQDGKYVCFASNAAGNDSRAAQMTIQHRPVVKNDADHPKNETIREGDDVTFTCRMIGNPTLQGYLWQVNGKNVTNFVVKPDSSTLTVNDAQANNVGTYSCLGYNSLGVGPPANAYLLIKIRPVVVEWPEEKLIVNESSSVQMLCKANGVPEPTYSWTKGASESVFSNGALLFIANASYGDAGKYKCTATNEMGKDTKERHLIVQVKPDIVTTSPLETNIPRNPKDNTATLTCEALTVPHAQMEWRKDGKKIESGQKYQISTTQAVDTSRITVRISEIADLIAEKYTCFARNLLGTDEQIFVIREKGITPDKPIELEAAGQPAENAGSVQLNLTWTPGYGGGLEQTFIVSYGKKGNPESMISTEVECSLKRLCALTIENLEPETTYGFQVQAKNKVGFGEKSQTLMYRTPASKQRGSVTARRVGNGEEVILSWKFTDEKVNCVNIYYRVKDSGSWVLWKDNVQKMNDTISGLSLDKAYQFRVEMLYTNEVTGMGVVVEVSPITGRTDDSKDSTILAPVIIPTVFVVCVSVGLFVWFHKKRQGCNKKDTKGGNNSTISRTALRLSLPGVDHDSKEEGVQNYWSDKDTLSNGTEDAPYEEIEIESLPPRKSWETKRENVVIEKVVGKGAFGQVAKGLLLSGNSNNTVAIKMLKANASKSDYNDLLSELSLMKGLKPHHHVIELIGCVTKSEPLLVVIEYAQYGDLLGFLRKSRGLNDTYYKCPDIKANTTLSPQQLFRFSWQVASGMEHLSSNKIVHRDLAARNILVGENFTCKVTDFGMARDVHGEDIYTRQSKGRLPVKWTALEALLYGRYTTESDVWSYGVLLYEIFTIGGCPYPDIDGRTLTQLIQEGYRMPRPEHLDARLQQIMTECWDEDPELRPTFKILRKKFQRFDERNQDYVNLEKYNDRLYANIN